MSRHALLLIGSPKPGYSSSESLGDYLLGQLQQKGYNIEKIKISRIIKTDIGIKQLISSINECDVLFMASPLYVDGVPAAVVKAMEIIAAQRKGRETVKKQILSAICNSGFPEANQNHPALDIYRNFARETGFTWSGGIALGGGGIINGKPLNDLGSRVKNVVRSLDLIAAALAGGNPVPKEAVELMAKPVAPHWLYVLFSQIGWHIAAIKNGAHKRLNDKPYQ